MSIPRRPEVVVVTGASAGVGRATACAFAARGAHVALLARGEAGLEGARRDVEAAGGKALVLPVDVADPSQVELAAAAAEEELGPIDIWVNNAMVSVFSPVQQMTAEEVRRVTEVTYLGTVYGTMAALKRMAPRDHGTIVQVGSALAYRAIPLQSAYCGAKHAIQGFTESLRSELLHDGSQVRVTMVQLPAIDTPQFDWVRTRLPNHPRPVPPIYSPEFAARAIVWAADRGWREVNVGSPTTLSILANKLVPGLLDRYLARTNYQAQQTQRLVDPDRPDNLMHPVDASRDFGGHGDFGEVARRGDPQWWITTHRMYIRVGAMLAVVAAALSLRKKRS